MKPWELMERVAVVSDGDCAHGGDGRIEVLYEREWEPNYALLASGEAGGWKR